MMLGIARKGKALVRQQQVLHQVEVHHVKRSENPPLYQRMTYRTILEAMKTTKSLKAKTMTFPWMSEG